MSKIFYDKWKEKISLLNIEYIHIYFFEKKNHDYSIGLALADDLLIVVIGRITFKTQILLKMYSDVIYRIS